MEMKRWTPYPPPPTHSVCASLHVALMSNWRKYSTNWLSLDANLKSVAFKHKHANIVDRFASVLFETQNEKPQRNQFCLYTHTVCCVYTFGNMRQRFLRWTIGKCCGRTAIVYARLAACTKLKQRLAIIYSTPTPCSIPHLPHTPSEHWTGPAESLSRTRTRVSPRKIENCVWYQFGNSIRIENILSKRNTNEFFRYTANIKWTTNNMRHQMRMRKSKFGFAFNVCAQRENLSHRSAIFSINKTKRFFLRPFDRSVRHHKILKCVFPSESRIEQYSIWNGKCIRCAVQSYHSNRPTADIYIKKV